VVTHCRSWLLTVAFGYCSYWLIIVFCGYCRSWLPVAFCYCSYWLIIVLCGYSLSLVVTIAFGYCSYWLIKVLCGYSLSLVVTVAIFLGPLKCLMRRYSRTITPLPYLSLQISNAGMSKLFSIDLLDVGAVVQSWFACSDFHILTL
jgi:hypothetical protein